MLNPVRASYWFLAGSFLVVGWLHMASAMLAVFFCYFALTKLHFGRNRWLAVGLFVVVLAGIAYGLAHFVSLAVVALPKIAQTAVPSFIEWAEQRGVQLPFTDFQSLKALILDSIRAQTHNIKDVANLAKGTSTKLLSLVIGAVVAASIFLNRKLDLDEGQHPIANNLYTAWCREIVLRFQLLYDSFATVMGAQIVISAVNTILTSVFVFAVSLPYAPVVIGVTFLCGLLPVVGNLVSNTVIVGIAFTLSPKMALAALIFLVIIHKLEYFLNSKIIGDRIKNPVWLTLVALIIGERLMGIPGMILAPVLLHYVKVEASRTPIPATPVETAGPPKQTGP